jgi:dihydrofolate reductase
MSMSLDGFVAGPDDGPGLPLGHGGELLHQWVYEQASWRARHGLVGGRTGPDDDLVAEGFSRIGAVVMGRRMFDNAEGPWGDSPPFHAPVFVLTHRPRPVVVKPDGTTFTFVTDGPECALRQARELAGPMDVAVAGGADVIRQYLRARLLDEIQIHLVHVLLNDGVRLFGHLGPDYLSLERTRVLDAPGVTHLRFLVETTGEDREPPETALF